MASHEMLGIGRLSRVHGTHDAEMAVLVSDDFQGRGLGTELLQRLIKIAREEKIERITADILAENRTMQRVCERVGFQLKYDPDDATVKVEMRLDQ